MKQTIKQVGRSALKQARRQSFEWVYPRWPAVHNAIFFDARRKVIKLLGLIRRRSWEWMPEVFAKRTECEHWQPLVSIIVPCFNHAQYLKARLDSIAGQSYGNVEIILLDDASSDGSANILRAFQEEHAGKSRLELQNTNSGKPFAQWLRGIQLAKGELIWIAESDDYCELSFLEQLVPLFRNRGVMLALGRSEFVGEDGIQPVWSLEEYLPEFGRTFWKKPFVESTHSLVQRSWGARNLIPNASGCVFRRPSELGLLSTPWWQALRVCGDWLFYLDLARGGLVAYQPLAKNYYRQHGSNSSVNQHKQRLYFEEHLKVYQWIHQHFSLGSSIQAAMDYQLKERWQTSNNAIFPDHLPQDVKRLEQKCFKPNILIVTYALVAGGGEIFPLRLAHGLRAQGCNVTILNCNQRQTEEEILAMVDANIAVITLKRLQDVGQIIRHLSIDIVHTHHAWVDTTISELLGDFPHVRHVMTSHGMYDYMDAFELKRIGRILKNSVSKATYVSASNRGSLEALGFDRSTIHHIANATEARTVVPFDRRSLNIEPSSIVLCLVSRAIREKGWEEAIKAISILRDQKDYAVHLLLVGDGPIKEELSHRYRDLPYIHFLGFQADTQNFFAGSDFGLLPSFFMGESQPLTLIECLLAGTPYIASALGDIPKMLESDLGLAGNLIPITNQYCRPEDIAESIRMVIENSKSNSSYQERTRLAAKKFSWNEMIANYIKVYDEVTLIDNEC